MTKNPLIPTALIALLLLGSSLPASAKTTGVCWVKEYEYESRSNYQYKPVLAKDYNCSGGNYIKIDCNGKGMSGESTNDIITATIHDALGAKVASWSGTVGCDLITDHTHWFIPNYDEHASNDQVLPLVKYPSAYYLHTYTGDERSAFWRQSGDRPSKGMYVVLSTDGSDAFWIDEMSIRDPGGSLAAESAGMADVAHWGQENGKGYCLSTDPSDAGGDWTNKVDGCHKEIKFVVGGCDYPNKGDNCEDNVYPVRPVSVTGYTVGKVTLTNGTTFSKEAENDEGQLWGEYGANGELAFTYFKMPASNTRYLQLASFPLELGIVLMVDLEEGKVARLNSITGTTDSYGDIKSSTR